MIIALLSLLTVLPGDHHFTEMKYEEAIAAYDSSLVGASDSASVLWRLARAYVCLGDLSEGSESTSCYREAEKCARSCLLADSTCSEGHTWLAAALGNIAMVEGGKKKVLLCYEIKKELDCSVRLNPRDDIAYSILGSFYMALGNVSWLERQLASLFLGGLPEGGYGDAEKSLQRAIALAPQVIRHHFEAGKLFLATDRTAEALEEFRKVTELPVLLASDRNTKRRAAEYVESLRKD